MKRTLSALAAALLAASPAAAQEWTSADPVLQRIWDEGMNRSALERLAHSLADSLGPRLTGTPQMEAAQDWLVRTYAGWGIPARNEPYGTWRGWRRGHTHVDLLAPRVRSLEGMMLAWSPGTGGRDVTGEAVLLPDFADAAAFQAWLPTVAGRFVAISFPQPTCRPDENWERWAIPADFERMKEERAAAVAAWNARIQRTGATVRELPVLLEEAGAAGVLTNLWSGGWGVDRIFNARTQRVPTVDLSCEDYGLVARLAENGSRPTLRLNADAAFTSEAEVPVANTLAEVRGRTRPNEYIMLSAHFDSWDGSSGATDNVTGTIVMLEAMRILREVYPAPNRTILVGHWNGEEQGLNGSRAFSEDNPRVVEGLHVLFNQDNGTGRIRNVSMQGFTEAAPVFRRWLARMPVDALTDSLRVDDPGFPGAGGSDYAAFVCHGAPAFGLSSLSWDYFAYTWHTTRDTYDKIVFDDVRRNAVMVAMLVYLADQEEAMLPRARRTEFPVNERTGVAGSWPSCTPATRRAADSTR
jgi:carboxypeptidase Q